MIAFFFIQNCCKCDYDHCKLVNVVMSYVMTITVLLRLATYE